MIDCTISCDVVLVQLKLLPSFFCFIFVSKVVPPCQNSTKLEQQGSFQGYITFKLQKETKTGYVICTRRISQHYCANNCFRLSEYLLAFYISAMKWAMNMGAELFEFRYSSFNTACENNAKSTSYQMHFIWTN